MASIEKSLMWEMYSMRWRLERQLQKLILPAQRILIAVLYRPCKVDRERTHGEFFSSLVNGFAVTFKGQTHWALGPSPLYLYH